MKDLQENSLRVIREYSSFLYTLDEAFEFVLECFRNPEKTQGDQLLGDIFAAFQQLLNSHTILEQLLDDEEVLQVIAQFEDILEKSLQFNGKLHNFEFKQRFVQQTFAPAFLAWSRKMQEKLKSYTAH